jgi:hypothetical protein
MKNTFLLVAAVIFSTVIYDKSEAQANHSQTSLADFQALQKGNAVQLSWTALFENNLSSHEIQKSTNGSSFASVGTVVAQNNATPFRYTFIDATPAEGNNYYRLRSLDKQGNETFSNILRVNNGFGRTEIRVLANPAQSGVLNLQMSNINSGKYAISLYSNSGQKVFARSLDLTNGSTTQTINLPQNLGRGMYFLQVTDGEMRINKEVLLQ